MASINGIQNNENVLYCLYARKSSEDDERQAMSIDSQIKEMTDLAEKEGLIIKEIRKESHSAKMSGQRPEFNKLLNDVRDGIFTGILTWAPDRLSRNAGDLGMIVDLMDDKKIIHIKTFTQAFSNSPSDKFLLMILCSQAKLENDQKGINVKRGIRAKCEMGWRPGMPPIGYFNRTMNGLKDIRIDPERGDVIKQMFLRVAKNGDSGRTIRNWFDEIGFTTRAGKKVALSQIYLMLKNPFYYGEFEYPVGSGLTYKGAHEPLTTKEIFNQVQKQLFVPNKRAKWGSKTFTFKGLFKCGGCGSTVIGEDRHRKRKSRDSVYHIYYHCTRQKNYDCSEPYVTEEKLIKELLRYIQFTNTAHPQMIRYTERLKQYMDEYKNIREMIFLQQNINPDHQKLDIYEYAKYSLKNSQDQEKRELVRALGEPLYIHEKFVCSTLAI